MPLLCVPAAGLPGPGPRFIPFGRRQSSN